MVKNKALQCASLFLWVLATSLFLFCNHIAAAAEFLENYNCTLSSFSLANVGRSSDNPYYGSGQGFTASTTGEIYSITIKNIYKQGSPTDNIQGFIVDENSPSLILDYSAYVLGSGITEDTNGQSLEFIFNNNIVLDQGEHYLFFILRSGSYSDTDYYKIKIDNAGSCAYDGATSTAVFATEETAYEISPSNDMIFKYQLGTESFFIPDFSSITHLDGAVNCCEDATCTIPIINLDDLTELRLFINDCESVADNIEMGSDAGEAASSTYYQYQREQALQYTFDTLGSFDACVDARRELGGDVYFRQFDTQIGVYASTSEYCLYIEEQTPDFDMCVDPCADMGEGLGNDVACGLRQAGCWFITPDPQAFNYLRRSFENLKKQFPFNLYFSLTDKIQEGLATSTIDDRSGSVGVVMYDGSDFYIQPVLSSSTMVNFFGEEKTNNFRTVAGYIMWACAAGYIIFRITKR
jgi:hypothetical protein